MQLKHILLLSGASVLLAGAPGLAQTSGQQGGVETVTVTAEKKVERLLDTPVPVTVVSGDDLAANNETKIYDYLASVPGLAMGGDSSLAGGTALEIRGIATSQYSNLTAPTIGFLIDGVPYGPSQVLFANGSPRFPDIDPSDIDRIEVLKGPQGTLYGSDSIGGVINIITKDPSTAGISGHVQAIAEDIPDGGAGYALRGAINVPLSNDLALRASAFDRHDPGYVDQVTTGKKNYNTADVDGAHFSLLYQPLENLSFKLSALVQNNDSHGIGGIFVNQYLQPVLNGLKISGLPGTGTNQYLTEAYSGVINASYWGINFVSTTGYNVQKNVHNEDFTGLFGPYVDGSPSVHATPSPFSGTAPNGSVFPSNYSNDNFSEEIRASSSYGDWLDWLIGGFYTHEANHGYTLITANNMTTGAYEGTFFTETSGAFGEPPWTLTEESVFGDLTVHFTDAFDIQVGARESWYEQDVFQTDFGPGYADFFGTPTFQFAPAVKGSDSAFTWLATPEYRLSADLMVYARVATGFEIGGVNSLAAAPVHTYGPSKTTNYEIGTKGSLVDGKISFDLSAYYIQWKDIQIAQIASGFIGYVANAGTAKSQGFEASIQAVPVDGLRIGATVSYNDAQLTAPFPPTAQVPVPSGTRLPYSTPYTGSLTVDWDAMHFEDGTAFVGGALNYLGKRPGEFNGLSGFARLNFPAYTTLNIYGGVRCGTWEGRLFVNNLTNKIGIVGGGGDFGHAVGNTGGYFAQVIQPRTIGFSLTKSF